MKPTQEELNSFVDQHVQHMSAFLNTWLYNTGGLLKDCDVTTRNKTMDKLVRELKRRIHYL